VNSPIVRWLQRVLPAHHAARLVLAATQLAHAFAQIRNVFRRHPIWRIVVDVHGVILKDRLRVEWNKKRPQLDVGKKNAKSWKLEDDVLALHGEEAVAHVLGQARIDVQVKPGSDDNSRSKLIRRALRADVLAIYNTPGYYRSLEPIQENVRQLKRLLDRDDCEVVIGTAVPDENVTGKAETEALLREVLGQEYFDKLYARVFFAGRKINKGDLFFHFIFEDNPHLSSYLGINAGVHLIVEAEHNRNTQLRWNQKFVPHGTDWAVAAGMEPAPRQKKRKKKAAVT